MTCLCCFCCCFECGLHKSVPRWSMQNIVRRDLKNLDFCLSEISELQKMPMLPGTKALIGVKSKESHEVCEVFSRHPHHRHLSRRLTKMSQFTFLGWHSLEKVVPTVQVVEGSSTHCVRCHCQCVGKKHMAHPEHHNEQTLDSGAFVGWLPPIHQCWFCEPWGFGG